ncbi:MAG: helix-turn-helix domain-containing protein [Chloroflexota bacterium]|nr:helix-turn-helix domain-containing protein [Chloroflexota bacterium]
MITAQLPPFAKLLRYHRIQADLTQEKLAERASLSARAISDLERGAKVRPHRVTVDLLADALDLTDGDRAALVAAVPGCTVPRPAVSNSPPEWVTERIQESLAGSKAIQCPPELRQLFPGLVALYLDEDRYDRQINITVVMFSTAEKRVTESSESSWLSGARASRLDGDITQRSTAHDHGNRPSNRHEPAAASRRLPDERLQRRHGQRPDLHR